MDDSAERLADAAMTLVCAPSMGGEGPDVCEDLLAAGVDEGRSALVVTYTRCPFQCAETLPDEANVERVLAVGTTPGPDHDAEGVPVDVVSTPEDVTALGIKLSRALANTDGDLVVCFDSVTAMLQYLDRETVYEFLHTVTGQLVAAGARSHLHMDPSAHERATVDLFVSLCDAVVDVGDDAAASTRTRSALR